MGSGNETRMVSQRHRRNLEHHTGDQDVRIVGYEGRTEESERRGRLDSKTLVDSP